MTSFTLFESHYFNLTTDGDEEGVSKEADVLTTPDSVQYEVVTSDHQHSPRMYGEDMTEVIIIRKCSTSLFCQRHRSIDFIAGWVGMVDDILEITQFIDV